MTSKTTVLAVVVGLVLLAVVSVAGAIVLLASNDQVPEQLWLVVSTIVGALAAMLVSTRSSLGANEQIPPPATPAPPVP